MLEGERPPILTDEHIISKGRRDYYRYRAEARDSDIPASFLEISKAFTLDFFRETSPKDMGELLFETKFDTDQDAWLAIKYAEAISVIKKFESELDYDSEGPIISRDSLNKVYLQIGFAVVSEFDGEETESVKYTVENYFQTHPFASLRMGQIAKEIGSGRIH